MDRPRRSAGVLVWAVVLGASWSLPTVALADGPATQPATAPATAEKLTFPTYGVSLDSPAGWTRISEGGGWQMVRWARLDHAATKVSAFMVAEAVPTDGKTLDELAKGFAERMGGKVAETSKSLGGARTLAMSIAGKEGQMRPRRGYLAVRGSYLYILSVIATSSNGVDAALDPVRRSWKWTPTEGAEKHLDLMPKPVSIFRNLVAMRFPLLARPIAPRSAQRRSMSLHVYDYATGKPGVIIQIDVIPGKRGMSDDQLVDGWGKLMAEKLKLAKPLAVSSKHEKPYRVLFEPMEAPVPPEMVPPGKGKPTVRYAMVMADDKVLSITFCVAPHTPEATRAYYELAERMIASATRPEMRNPATAPGTMPADK